MRMIGRFRPDAVPDVVIREMLTAATQAPSGGNRQPWRFIYVRNHQGKQRLHDIIMIEWCKQAEERRAQGLEPERNTFVGLMETHPLTEVPLVMVVLSTDRRDGVIGGEEGGNNAIQNLLLMARAHGLGGRITYAHLYNEEAIRSELGVPPDLDILAFIPLGYPLGVDGHRHGPKRRKPIEEIASEGRWSEAITV
jgi:nitroreductase